MIATTIIDRAPAKREPSSTSGLVTACLLAVPAGPSLRVPSVRSGHDAQRKRRHMLLNSPSSSTGTLWSYVVVAASVLVLVEAPAPVEHESVVCGGRSNTAPSCSERSSLMCSACAQASGRAEPLGRAGMACVWRILGLGTPALVCSG
jgi:hypothetical protein